MPRILKLFRPKSGDNTSAKSSKAKQSSGSVFRRKESTPRGKNGKVEIQRTTAPVPIEQTITWTMSDETASPVSVQQTGQHQQAPEPSPSQESVASKFIFTEEDLIENELNHIQALTALEIDINKLKKTTEDLVQKHATEMAKKDDEYVELLIQVTEREEEVALLRAELKDTKKELEVVSCKLVQTQHEFFENNLPSFWSSLFN